MSFSASGGTITSLFTTTSFPSIAQMVLDESSNVLYCVNGGSTILCRRLNYSTTFTFTISPTLNMYGVAIYNKFLYVSNWNGDNVYRVPLSTIDSKTTTTTAVPVTLYTSIRATDQNSISHGPGLICFDDRGYLYCGNWNTNSCTVFNTNGGSTTINFIGKITPATNSYLKLWAIAVNYNPSPIDNKRYIWFFTQDGCRAGFTDVTNISGNIINVPSVSGLITPQYNALNGNGPAPTVNSLGRVYMAVSSNNNNVNTRSVMTLDKNLTSSTNNVYTQFIGVTGKNAMGNTQPPTTVLQNTNDVPSCIFCSLDNNLYIYCDGTGNFYKYTFQQPTIGSLNLSSADVGTPLIITQPSSNSGGSFTYSSSNKLIATISGNTITPVRAGTCIITARQIGYDNYSAGTVTATLTVTGDSIEPPPVNNNLSTITLYSVSSFLFA